MTNRLKSAFKNNIPVFVKRFINRIGLFPGFIPPQGQIDWGDFNSVRPFSNDFGFDRGGAVDRYYIEKFLSEQSAHIKGNVLEIADNAYTLKYGGNGVIKSDVLHLNAGTSGATYNGDLSKGDGLPSEHFDCIILTQTLQFIYDYTSALKNCYRILKKDGILLITVPGISPIDQGEWGKNWLWSFNENSIRRIFMELFPANTFKIQAYGNVYAATTFLYGAGINEVDKSKLDIRDTAFDVVIAIQLKKQL